MPRSKQLTPRQHAFVTAYIDGGCENASEAYRIAYPISRNWSQHSVAKEAGKMLRHPYIVPLVAAAHEKRDAALTQAVNRYVVSKDSIIREMAAIANSDIRNYLSWGPKSVVIKPSDQLTDMEAAAISKVSFTKAKDGSSTFTFELWNKPNALTSLVRVHDQMALEMAQRGDQTNPEVLQQQEKARKMLMDLLQAMAIPEPLVIDGE